MRFLVTSTFMLLGLAVIAGCTSISESARNAGNGLGKATLPLRQSLSWATRADQPTPVIDWHWTMGIPVDAPRGELLAATVPGDVIAQLLPQLPQNQIQLVSMPSQFAGYEIRNIEGKTIDNCSDLHVALEEIPDTATEVQVDLALAGAQGESSETALRIDHPTLMALSHATAQSTNAFRVSEGGNPMFVVRDAGVRSHIVVRVERNLGLVQLVMKCTNCWQDNALLPVEVGVQAGGKSLQCLTVADALELLYGKPDPNFGEGNPSFAQTSEREDYLLPVNYKRLSERFEDRKGLTSQSPAFASLTGMRYPGPAVLGDARALTGILHQKEILKKGESSRTGWLLFANNGVRTAQHIDVIVDLGSGPQTYRFMIPAAQ